MAIIRGARELYWKWQYSRNRRSKPSVDISLSIRVKKDYEPDGYYYLVLGEAMVNLKYLADEVAQHLFKMYPLFAYNQNLNISVNQRSWRLGVSMSSGQLTERNNSRIISHLRKLKIVDNSDVSLSTNSIGLLRETRCETNCVNGTWATTPKGPKTKKLYYLG
jgi:hypothetical protein